MSLADLNYLLSILSAVTIGSAFYQGRCFCREVINHRVKRRGEVGAGGVTSSSSGRQGVDTAGNFLQSAVKA